MNKWVRVAGSDIEVCSLPDEKLLASLPAEFRVIDKTARVMDYIMSDESFDLRGTIIRVRGHILDYFRRRGVILWAHDSGFDSVPAIGKPIGARKTEWNGKQVLQTRLQFASFEQHKYPLAEIVGNLALDGVLPNGSIGFLPFKRRKIEAPEGDLGERWKEMGLDCYEITRDLLLEFSPCNIGANLNAGASEREAMFSRAEQVAKEKLSGRDLDTFMRDFRGGESKRLSIPIDPLMFAGMANLEEDERDDSFLHIGTWDNRPIEVNSPPAAAAEMDGRTAVKDQLPAEPPAPPSAPSTPPSSPAPEPQAAPRDRTDEILASVERLRNEVAEIRSFLPAIPDAIEGLAAHLDQTVNDFWLEDIASRRGEILSGTDDGRGVPAPRPEVLPPPASTSESILNRMTPAEFTEVVAHQFDAVVAKHRGVIRRRSR